MAVHERKNSKYLGMYNIGRPSNFRLGLRSPNVERNKCMPIKIQGKLYKIRDLTKYILLKYQKLLITNNNVVNCKTERRPKLCLGEDKKYNDSYERLS